MKVKLSNYVAQFLVDHGIDTVFTVTGGGAMHLNDGFGKQKGLHCVYQHHEQACAIAGEAYARIHNKIGAVCVTTGPGGTNAITGVVGGWLDSIPMLVISGQVRYDTTARSTGLGIRAMGDQEFDICKAVESMTKYCEMVIDPLKIRYCLEKALFLALNGRQGPCWLDIPVNIQGSYIDTDELVGFDPKKEFKENGRRWQEEAVPAKPSEETIEAILEKVKAAKRPVINAGSAIRYSGGFQDFEELVNRLNIPVVTGWNSIDVIPDEDERYTGRAGIMGDRAGNFAIQNSDLVLSLGSRLSIRQVGYNFKTWAREAYTIVVDVDPEELKKPTIHVSMPVCADVKDVMQMMNQKLSEQGYGEDRSKMFVNTDAETVEAREAWLSICQNWKEKYPVVQPKHYESQKYANVYAFVKTLSDALPENYITVVGNGSACVVGSHAYTIKKGQRFIINSAIASMGYDLPAAIGACVANKRYCKETGEKEQDIICVTGDGSIQMNLQELQTIIHHQYPIKIFLINNGGYHSIRQTQNNYFGKPLIGIGKDSGDLSFPDMAKLAPAYGFPFIRIDSNDALGEGIEKALSINGPVICEVMVDMDQKFEPKAASKPMPDGSMVSAPLEDLAPFLPEEELKSIMRWSSEE